MRQIVKKAVICLFTLTLLLSLGTTAFAEGEQYVGDVTITINNAYNDGNKPYQFYRMLEINSADYRYQVPLSWKGFFTSEYGAQFVTLNDDVAYSEIVTDIKPITDVEKFAQEAYNYVISNGLMPNDTTVNETPNENGAIVHKLDAPGYYLIVSPKGKICSAVYVNREAEINEKNVNEPSAEYYILDNGIPKRYADAQAGSIVEYLLKLNLVEGLRGFNVEALLPNDICKIIDASIVVEGMTLGDYGEVHDRSSIKYTLAQDFLDSIKSPKTVTIKFKAKFSDTANFHECNVSYEGGGYQHRLQYSYNDLADPIMDCIKLYTWDFTINDYITVSDFFKDNEDIKMMLPNVHYVLSRTNNAENPDAIDFLKVSDGVYRIATADDYTGAGLVDMVTDLYYNTDGIINMPWHETDSHIKLQGLDSGTYYLIQTSVPYGYSRTTEPIKIEIAPTEDTDGLSFENDKIEFIHTANSFTLPSTGGPGTILLMTLSLTLFVLTLAVIITKLRIFNKANRR